MDCRFGIYEWYQVNMSETIKRSRRKWTQGLLQIIFKAKWWPQGLDLRYCQGVVTFKSILFVPLSVPYRLFEDCGTKKSNVIKLYNYWLFITDHFPGMPEDLDEAPLNILHKTLEQYQLLKVTRKNFFPQTLDMVEEIANETCHTNMQFGMNKEHTNCKHLKFQSPNHSASIRRPYQNGERMTGK